MALVPCLSCLQTDLIPLPDWLLPRVGVCTDTAYLIELPVIMSRQSDVDLDGDGTQELIASGEEYLAISTLPADDGYYASQIWTFVGASMGAPAAGVGAGAASLAKPSRRSPPSLTFSVMPRPFCATSASLRDDDNINISIAYFSAYGSSPGEARVWRPGAATLDGVVASRLAMTSDCRS